LSSREPTDDERQQSPDTSIIIDSIDNFRCNAFVSAHSMTTIQVLGLGRCDAVRQRTRVGARQLGLDAPVENVEDVAEIVRLGVMSAPALVPDGRVLVAGGVPSVDQVRELLAAAGE
jgi:hypothetical protein